MVGKFLAGDSFGHIYCFNRVPHTMSLVAVKDCRVLEFSAHTLMNSCGKNCVSHCKVLYNLLTAFSNKVVDLSRKLSYLHLKTLREKLACYLLECCDDAGSQRFEVSMHLNRQAALRLWQAHRKRPHHPRLRLLFWHGGVAGSAALYHLGGVCPPEGRDDVSKLPRQQLYDLDGTLASGKICRRNTARSSVSCELFRHPISSRSIPGEEQKNHPGSNVWPGLEWMNLQ